MCKPPAGEHAPREARFSPALEFAAIWHENRDGVAQKRVPEGRWSVEIDQIQQMLVGGFSGVFKVFGEYADGLTAAFALLLGYRLMKVGIERSSTANGALVMPAYLARVVPGAAIALVGAVFMLNRSPLTLLLYLWSVTVLVGFGLAVLGYRLFAVGAMGDSEVEAGWTSRRLVSRGAAPAVFALPGLVMIVLAIWQGPSIVREYQAASLQADQQATTVVNEPMAGLKMDVVATPLSPGSVEPTSGDRTSTETRPSR